MNQQLKNDQANFGNLLEQVKMHSVKYLNNINNRPTSTIPQQFSTDDLLTTGVGAAKALTVFNQRFEDLMVASAGPRYWGFVIGGATPASVMGDWLTSIYDQNPQATSGSGDISGIIEMETIQLLQNLFGLPNGFAGGFVSGATMSNFTCLATARQWIGRTMDKDFAREGVAGTINILTAVPHSSAVKCLSMLGIGSNNFTTIKTIEGNREAMDIADLEREIQVLNGQPFILISSAGTVNTADFDDFEAISKLKANHNFWWHIDGAFGAFAACSPNHKHLINGWENADSIAIDCHKWLNVPYENAAFFIKAEHKKIQTETFQNSNAPYLGNPLDDFNYLNFLPENSRRLKALPVWFTLMAYGKKGYQDIVENSIAMANLFGNYINQSNWFQLLAPVRLNNVCFTLKNKNEQLNVHHYLKQLNNTGKVFMTPTVYKGERGIRASFVNWRTNAADIKLATEEMEKIAVIL